MGCGALQDCHNRDRVRRALESADALKPGAVGGYAEYRNLRELRVDFILL